MDTCALQSWARRKAGRAGLTAVQVEVHGLAGTHLATRWKRAGQAPGTGVPGVKATDIDEKKVAALVAHLKSFGHRPGREPLSGMTKKETAERRREAAQDPDFHDIVTRGQLFSGKNAVVKLGDPNRCHTNVAKLYAKTGGKIAIATGYYRPPDGFWRQHSWGVERSTGRVVETTAPSKENLYFGAILSPKVSKDFCRSENVKCGR